MVNLTTHLSTLITANHILHHHSVLDAMGHISARNPNNASTFFLALQMGPAVVRSAHDIGEYLVEDGSPVVASGTRAGYAERFIHSEVLRRYPDVGAVVHSHAEDVLPYTVLGEGGGVEAVYHMAGFLGSAVPNFDIETAYNSTQPRDLLVNTPALGAALASYFGTNTTQPTSPLHTLVLQRGHGFVAVGASIEQAVDYAYYAASNARVQTKAILLNAAIGGGAGNGNGSATGGIKYLSERERVDCKNMNAWIAFKPWEQWVWEVERSGNYVNELGTPPTGS